MIKKILIGFLLATLALLVLLWLVTGGPGKVLESARGIGNAFNLIFWSGTTTGQFHLPWQPEGLMLGPEFAAEAVMKGDDEHTEDDLASAEAEYEAMKKQIDEAKTFGEPSPHRGAVFINEAAATETSPNSEYLEIEASLSNTAPVSLAGWSVQSALTGLRAFIPRGAERFVLGSVNEQSTIALAPGMTAVLSSGFSPVGTSFRVNICSGYLGGLQTFTPSLSRNCPPPSETLPLTPENLKTYGDACYDYVQILPSCFVPVELPSDISPQCKIFLSNNISYNGCAQNNSHRSSFFDNSWRIYLSANSELWRNTHDIIRLLDAEGRTVDVVSY